MLSYRHMTPVMYSDSSGTMPKWLRWTLVGVGAAAAVAAIVVGSGALISSEIIVSLLVGGGWGSLAGGLVGGLVAYTKGEDLSSGILSGQIVGFSLGMAGPLSSMGLKGFGILVGSTMLSGSLGYTIETYGNNEKYNFMSMLKSGMITTVQGIILFKVEKLISGWGDSTGITEKILEYFNKAIGDNLAFALEFIVRALSGDAIVGIELLLEYLGVWLP